MLLNYAISPKPLLSNDTTPNIPLVLLHGLFGSLDNLGMIKKAQQEHMQVLSIDMLNHGQSPHVDTFDYDDMAQTVLELLDHLDIVQCYLLGHSMGGKVAMKIALMRPNLVKKLIIADIAPVQYQARHHNVLKGLSGLNPATVTSRKQADQILAEHIVEQGVRAFLLKSLEITPDGAKWRFNLTAIKNNYDKLSQAIEADNAYTKPVLFIKGSNSDYIKPEHRDMIGRLFPASRAHVVNDTGHWLQAEKPAVFNRIVSRFLNEK